MRAHATPPKIMKYFFLVLLFVMPTVCEGNENGDVRIDFTSPMFSKLHEEEKNALREYAKAYPRIKKIYRNMRMDVTKKVFRHTADEELSEHIPLNTPPTMLIREDFYEVRYNTQNGKFSRVDSQIKFILGENVQTDSSKAIRLFTPDMAYVLSKSNSHSQFYALTIKRSYDTFMSDIGAMSLEFDIAPLSVGPMLTEDFLFKLPSFALIPSTNYHIDSVSTINGQDGWLTEIKCRFINESWSPPGWQTWTIRLCRESWVVRDVLEQGSSRRGHTFWKRYLRTYDGEFEGIPLLSSYQIDYGIYDPDDGETERMISRVQYDVTQIIPGPVDLSEFDVAQFLPPNVKIGEITQAQLSPARIAAIIIGIILIILGIYLKIRSIRKE